MHEKSLVFIRLAIIAAFVLAGVLWTWLWYTTKFPLAVAGAAICAGAAVYHTLRLKLRTER